MARQVYFLHIPKSGGTSVRNMLTEHFDADDVFPTAQMLQDHPQCYHSPAVFKQLWADSGRTDWKLVNAHVPYWQVRQLLQDDCLRVTYLREPLARAISEIAHHRVVDPRWGRMGFDRIVRDHPSVYQKQFGLGFYFARTQQASLRVLRGFDVIGLQARFDESLELLEHHLATTLQQQHANVGDRGTTKPTRIGLDAIYELQKRLSADQLLYTAGCARFHQQINQMRRAQAA